jgi:hypothetical protein
MNEFISKYIDLMALAFTVVMPFVVTIQLKRKAGKKLRAVPVYFFVFGPSGILTFMFFHLFENIYRAITAYISGSFQYNFKFYSLLLLGVVVAYLGIQFIIACHNKCLEGNSANRPYFSQILLILLFTLPLIPIIPIAAVPLICCIISLLAFAFVRRSVKQNKVVLTEEALPMTVSQNTSFKSEMQPV